MISGLLALLRMPLDGYNYIFHDLIPGLKEDMLHGYSYDQHGNRLDSDPPVD